jgi:hypothetical protein
MAVGRLSGAWVRQVLAEVYPDGVVRRVLLEHFARLLVSRRSSPGAKGRLARRLYRTLLKLERRGLILQAEGLIRLVAASRKSRGDAPPELGPVLERWLFKALLAEDGQGDGHTPAALLAARGDFIARALEADWTLPMAASALGLAPAQALRSLEAKVVGV